MFAERVSNGGGRALKALSNGRHRSMELTKEEKRLLHHLAKQSAMLEVPPRNQAIESIVQKGLASWNGSFQERWNNRLHDCSTLSITETGRRAIQ